MVKNIIEKYEKRQNDLNKVSLAQFAAWYEKSRNGDWTRRSKPKIIRYVNYEASHKDDYRQRTMFRNEEV